MESALIYSTHNRMASENNKENEGSKQSTDSTPLSMKKNRGERKSTNPLNWYSCKGVTFMNGDIHKDQRHPRCFGIRSKIMDADMLDVLHHERPQKHWKSNKAIDLRKGDFFHTCVGSSHFSIPSSKKAVNPKRQQRWQCHRHLIWACISNQRCGMPPTPS